MRKIVSIISVCLVCLMLCVYAPINGRAMSFNDEPLRYSVLQFDYIETPAYTIPCPFNSASAGTQREPFSFGDVQIYGHVTSVADGAFVDGFLTPLIYDEVTFYSELQVVRLYALNNFYSYFVAAGTVGQILTGAEISCTVLTLNDDWSNSNRVGVAHHNLSGVIAANANGTVSFSQGLYNLLVDNGYSGDSLVLLSDLKITLSYTMDSVDSASLMLSSHYTSYDPDMLFGQWSFEQGITVPDASTGSSDFNFGTWLADSVGGFLKAELFPGFSIDKLFYAVLVIGVLLWFIKVFS